MGTANQANLQYFNWADPISFISCWLCCSLGRVAVLWIPESMSQCDIPPWMAFPTLITHEHRASQTEYSHREWIAPSGMGMHHETNSQEEEESAAFRSSSSALENGYQWLVGFCACAWSQSFTLKLFSHHRKLISYNNVFQLHAYFIFR